jgi:hypothetical protein
VGQELLTLPEHTSIVSFNINTNGATSGTGTTNLSGAYEYIQTFHTRLHWERFLGRTCIFPQGKEEGVDKAYRPTSH